MANAKPSDQAKALRAFADELERTGRTLPTDVLEELAVLVAEDTPVDGDEAFMAEIQRRLDAARSGAMSARPAHEVVAELLKR